MTAQRCVACGLTNTRQGLRIYHNPDLYVRAPNVLCGHLQIDLDHFLATVRHNFEPGTRLALAGTIQFASSLHAAKRELAKDYPSIIMPQAKPLSPGEVLGCTGEKFTTYFDHSRLRWQGRHPSCEVQASRRPPRVDVDVDARALS